MSRRALGEYAAILAGALACKDSRALRDLAAAALVPRTVTVRASRGARGQETAVQHYLRLCCAVGLDPTGAGRRPPAGPVMFLGRLFGEDLFTARRSRGHTLREAAREMDISATSVKFIEDGKSKSFECVAAACRYLGKHPFDYLVPNVSRETLSKNSGAIAA